MSQLNVNNVLTILLSQIMTFKSWYTCGSNEMFEPATESTLQISSCLSTEVGGIGIINEY